ncbi:MAG TPA: endolytic transglycosylase MltG [Candidatus Acidoferrum sp.]
MKFLAKVLLLLLLIAAAGAAYFWHSMHAPYGNIPPEGTFVEVPHGASQRSVARLLKQAGIIRSPVAFEIYARRHPRRSLQAGEYFFDHPLSGKDVYWKLANGDVFEQPFTVREGETIFDIAHDLETAKYMPAEEFLAAAQNPKLILDIAPNAKTLEGFLFPATYNLPRRPHAQELTAAMVRKFQEALQKIAPERLAPDGSSSAGGTAPSSLLRVVTLASLVERETPKPDERLVVAGVFTNRLQKGMLLQCDPTVIYALQQENRYTGALTLKDLRIDSPYNTYEHTGLPPGPIGNPGEVSLRAALKPAETDYLYFVANTHGGHFFAATLADHNKNVARYHRLLIGEPVEDPVTEAHRSSGPSSERKEKR